MCHVDQQIRTDLVGNRAKARVIQVTRIGGETRDDHLGTLSQRNLLELIVVDGAIGGLDAVLHRAIGLAREVDLGTVSQVTTVIEAHAQHGVAGLQQRQIHRTVGL